MNLKTVSLALLFVLPIRTSDFLRKFGSCFNFKTKENKKRPDSPHPDYRNKPDFSDKIPLVGGHCKEIEEVSETDLSSVELNESEAENNN